MPQPQGFEPVARWELELLWLNHPGWKSTPLYMETVREHRFDPILTAD